MAPASEVFVRPFGYDAGVPVVRQIGDRKLYLGNVHGANDAEAGFDHVLTLTEERIPATTHHCPLVDSDDNDWIDFERAVDAARELIRKDGSLLVHCEHGISRSSTVIATAIAADENTTFHEALSEVQNARPHAIPNPHLHEQAVVYLASRSGDADTTDGRDGTTSCS